LSLSGTQSWSEREGVLRKQVGVVEEIMEYEQQIDLEFLDYDEFVESKWKWVKRRFLWIFEPKKALNDKGIEIDYPELLIKTGDIWQIVYPERAYRIIPVWETTLS